MVDMYAILIITLLFVIFSIVFLMGSQPITAEFERDVARSSGYIVLLDFLRTPMDFRGETISMADYLDRMHSYDKGSSTYSEMRKEIINKRNTHFEKANPSSWNLNINYYNKGKIIDVIMGNQMLADTELDIIPLYLPSRKGTQIELLFAWEQ